MALRNILTSMLLMYYYIWLLMSLAHRRKCLKVERRLRNRELKIENLNKLIGESGRKCISELRMDRRTFFILCEMLRDVGGQKRTQNMSLEEIVAQFLYTLSHHLKNRTIGRFFLRSGETVSRQFNLCLLAVLKLQHLLLKTPEPILENSTDDKWKYFKNCFGALDGTHIKVTVPTSLKGRYRSRKADVVANVLGVCAPDMQFIYVLPGWEGSAHDGRVLRDAISRPNGLHVPHGCYYLVEAGYTNANGFLAPYRGQWCHLGGWTARNPPPHSAEEYFNMCHARARNRIERGFGRLKVMDTSESSTSVRGKGKNKRKWTAIEDDELINMLYEVCLDPKWRSDSSFKNGYMSAIEAHLAKKLPEARITAVPHIESRLRYFKSKFSSLEQMLVLSGFTWDENKKMCKKQQYDNQCKSHPDAKGLYGIPFPYYDTLSAIYSKDLTTGEGAEDMSDAVNNLEQELAAGIGNGQEEEERASRETPRRSFDSTSSTSKKHKKDRKPKESVSNDPLLDMFSEVSQDLKRVTKSVDKMAQAMAREAAAQEKIIIEDPDQKLRENAVSELRKLEITGSELIQAASVFARMPDQMVMMFALPELLRREYVVNMLHDETQRKERGKQGGSS